ncbi:ankyrin [Obba rivulosa]|uniref:Ankyrin n=1 Tax=Obba rivulosa TaxID=1052685 RepID=A0A8E2J4I4_9APHY|nr:ankyrin [Obba rivulosa]
MARTSNKNIWVAAGDGDLERVMELVEGQSMSPNVPDPNTYTPMHAAASYGHLHVLQYLIAKGGDVNVTDEDGDTPLYVVEDVATARFLVEHGAIADHRNFEGVSPVEHLLEDFPEVATYLESLRSSLANDNSISPTLSPTHSQPSQHVQNLVSEHLTSSLMESVDDIMTRAEAEGRDPDAELRQVVGRAVLEGVATGYSMGTDEEQRGGAEHDHGPNGVKRSRTDLG